ncbi:MAG: WD40 repeat domain-containing serine/threonine-protein kinase, partial [Thermoguttaceae bacterium]
MSWPRSRAYFEAVQNLRWSMSDEELRDGQAALNSQELPLSWKGGFAVVFKIECPATGNTWALKCFTREVADQCNRYREISAHLDQVKLPFTVDFQYLESGIRIAGRWFPVLKMRWVEGLDLNQFVDKYVDKPKTNMLDQLLGYWPKLARRLYKARMAHADLQHGNVLLVPMPRGRLALKLIDYDGMYVPSLAGRPSGELGLPAYQHPLRLDNGTYSIEVDRFSHLTIYCAVHCVRVGSRELWQRFNNDNNLLFREADFRDPGKSDLFRELWELPDADARALVGRLALACRSPLEETPLLEEVLAQGDGKVIPLSAREESAVKALLSPKPTVVPPRLVVAKAIEEPPVVLAMAIEEPPVVLAQVVEEPPMVEVTVVEPDQSVVETRSILDGGTLPVSLVENVALPPRRVHYSFLHAVVVLCNRNVFPVIGRVLLAMPRVSIAPARAVDRLLLAMVGKENTILHNFVRVLAVIAVVIGLFIGGNSFLEHWQAFCARELAAVQQAEKEAAKEKAEEKAAAEKVKADAEKAEFGMQIRTFSGHDSVTSVAFSPDGKRMLIGSLDKMAILWDASTGAQIHAFIGNEGRVTSVAFSPDGKRVLTGSEDRKAMLWDASTGAQIRTFSVHGELVNSVAFSLDGTRVLTGSYDQTAIVWDASTGAQIRTFKGHNASVSSVAFSPDGKRVLTGSLDNTAILWDANTGAKIRTFSGHGGAISSVVFSPDGKLVLTGSEDKTAILWDANTGAKIRTFSGHGDLISSVAFSPDGKRVLTGSWDTTAILWDADISKLAMRENAAEEKAAAEKAKADAEKANFGKQIHTFRGHNAAVSSVAFSPDGKRVLTGSWDTTAILWDVSTGA